MAKVVRLPLMGRTFAPIYVGSALTELRDEARPFSIAAQTAAGRKDDGQGETARQPGNTEAEDSEIDGRRAGLAFRPKGSICCDDPAEAEVKAEGLATRSRESTSLRPRSLCDGGGAFRREWRFVVFAAGMACGIDESIRSGRGPDTASS